MGGALIPAATCTHRRDPLLLGRGYRKINFLGKVATWMLYRASGS